MGRVFLALIRHGEYLQPADTPSAHLPHPLSDVGERQAIEAAGLVAETARSEGWSIDRHIDASSLLRGWQTARLIAEHLPRSPGEAPLEVSAFDELAERSLGAAANLTLARIDEVVAADPRLSPLPENWKAQTHFRLPVIGAESLYQAGARVAEHLRRRTEPLAESGADVLKIFVGHGGAFRHAALHLGVLDEDRIPGLSMHHARPVYLERLSDGAFRHAAGEWKIRRRKTEDID
ncbi:MAG: histidine phosphatase family protein [Deltaproteobacteria bacterium]|nr:histidine phosphatase family protein [Deltaproteobacteria bacterium]